MPTKRIKRFEPELHWKHAGNPSVRMEEKVGGQFVHHADYEKLEERVLALVATCNHEFEPVNDLGSFTGFYHCKKCGLEK